MSWFIGSITWPQPIWAFCIDYYAEKWTVQNQARISNNNTVESPSKNVLEALLAWINQSKRNTPWEKRSSKKKNFLSLFLQKFFKLVGTASHNPQLYGFHQIFSRYLVSSRSLFVLLQASIQSDPACFASRGSLNFLSAMCLGSDQTPQISSNSRDRASSILIYFTRATIRVFRVRPIITCSFCYYTCMQSFTVVSLFISHNDENDSRYRVAAKVSVTLIKRCCCWYILTFRMCQFKLF